MTDALNEVQLADRAAHAIVLEVEHRSPIVPTARQLADAVLAIVQPELDLATEFRIPCPEPADPGRPDGAPVMHPEALIVRKSSPGYLGDTDGWTIINPNFGLGENVWTGTEWKYRGELHRETIYRWTRDQALTEAQRLAVDETARYEAWLVTMRAGRRTT